MEQLPLIPSGPKVSVEGRRLYAEAARRLTTLSEQALEALHQLLTFYDEDAARVVRHQNTSRLTTLHGLLAKHFRFRCPIVPYGAAPYGASCYWRHWWGVQVSALYDMLVQGHFDLKRPVIFRDPTAIQMLLDGGKCSSSEVARP